MKTKKAIKHASEVYPNCSKQFATGVHTWINLGEKYDINLMFYENEDFKNGFWTAQIDLGDNYEMYRGK